MPIFYRPKENLCARSNLTYLAYITHLKAESNQSYTLKNIPNLNKMTTTVDCTHNLAVPRVFYLFFKAISLS
jgi:hypothetical protein